MFKKWLYRKKLAVGSDREPMIPARKTNISSLKTAWRQKELKRGGLDIDVHLKRNPRLPRQFSGSLMLQIVPMWSPGSWKKRSWMHNWKLSVYFQQLHHKKVEGTCSQLADQSVWVLFVESGSWIYFVTEVGLELQILLLLQPQVLGLETGPAMHSSLDS